MANNTIFDDVFRTMMEKMPELVIPLINEVFKTDYPSDIEIRQGRNEHTTETGTIITDSYLQIADKRYHIECQSTEDRTMVLRMIEYDFAIGLEHAQKVNGRYQIRLPSSCVLFLRGNSREDSLRMDLISPDGQCMEYIVPVIKTEWYYLDELFQKNLVMLFPFYIMRYENRKDALKTDDLLQKKLFGEYEEIEAYLENLFLKKEMEKEFYDITELIVKVTNYIFSDLNQIQKGLGVIMGGKVLELKTDKLINQGKMLGFKQGVQEGIEQGLQQGIEQGLQQGLQQGLAQGEDSLADLIKILLNENRLDDLKRISEDPLYRKQLLAEMKKS